jgi:hypothetical protein
MATAGSSEPLAEIQDAAQQEQSDRAEDDQATVNWGGVLIPLIVVLVVIFVVGLFLMRIWHWIDPT